MTININNLDTDMVHIDTYQMLTGDNFTDYELETLQEQYPECTYDDFEWTYDHENIVKDLAMASIDILSNAIDNDIIKSIEYVSSTSPRFYNYTSDSYIMAVTVDEKELNEYIQLNFIELRKILASWTTATKNSEWYVTEYTPIDDINASDLQHASITHILDNCMTEDNYNMAMWEIEMEAYMENTTITKLKK